MPDSVRFSSARAAVLSESAAVDGIGRLSEKVMHRILKFYLEPNESFHEVAYLGSVCDIKNDQSIYEIQTASYEKLVPKLKKLMKTNKVTVVCPLAGEKLLHWIDPETGEISAGKRSPKREGVFDALYHLSKLGDLVLDPNFTARVIVMRVDEYRHLDGWSKDKKRGATKEERIPNAIMDELVLCGVDSYKALLPEALGDEFLAAELQRLIKRTSRYTYNVLRFFVNAGVISKGEKRGRAFVYKRI